MPKKKSTPAIVVKAPKRTRFKAGRITGELALERLVPDSPLGADAPRVLLIVAHPDDEAIGAGVLLAGLPDATIVHVTDGAPRDNRVARRRGYPNRDAYAEARRAEVLDAVRLAGMDESRVRTLGMVDGEATLRMVELCHRVIDLIIELDPEIVLTHPYEGGHTDHDTTAFAVHLACGILRREGVEAPVVLELASYHNRNGKRVRSQFIPRKNVPVRSLEFTPEEQLLKIRMFEQFVSQRECLSAFPVTAENFRVAPRYTFTAPPHEGELDYERYCAAICGEEWRAHAAAALEQLRSRHRMTPNAP